MENIREDLVEHSAGISRKTVIVSLVIASGSFLTLTAATIVGTEALLRKDIDRQVEEILQEQVDYRETYLGDRDFLNSASFFKPALPQAVLKEKQMSAQNLTPCFTGAPIKSPRSTMVAKRRSSRRPLANFCSAIKMTGSKAVHFSKN